MLQKIQNQLIVSCQPVIGGVFDHPSLVVAFAQAALDGGAKGLRIEGIENLKAVRQKTNAPIIGLIKRDFDDYDIRITPLKADVEALCKQGADIIAIDATKRPRPASFGALAEEAKAHGKLVMADCSCLEDGLEAKEMGADILGTTLAGYTGSAEPTEPDIALVKSLSSLGCFVIAEGCYHRPEQALLAKRAGADAVVIGSAITRPELITSWFAHALNKEAY